MSKDKFMTLLWLLIPQILQLLTEKKRLGNSEAIKVFYHSEIYDMLSQEETKLWHLSALTLYNLLEEELTTGHINYPEEQ
jgi:uncharacterized protein YqcC (DUF446 family)